MSFNRTYGWSDSAKRHDRQRDFQRMPMYAVQGFKLSHWLITAAGLGALLLFWLAR